MKLHANKAISSAGPNTKRWKVIDGVSLSKLVSPQTNDPVQGF